MATSKTENKRIVLMSSSLMELYDVIKPGRDLEHQPITFHDPQECLKLLLTHDEDEELAKSLPPAQKAERIEKQWGELELRLSFFTDALNWQ